MNTSQVLLDEIIILDEPGFACSKSKLVENGLIHLRPFNVSNNGTVCFDEIYQVPFEEAPKNKRSLDEGDILFNNTNSAELVGKTALVQHSINAGFSNHLTRIRVDRAKVMPQYMAYWLRWMQGKGYFSAHATQWVSQAAFKSSELRQMEMPLPSLPEQHRLVDILSRAEGIVRLRCEAQKRAQELIPALFLDMFGDPATNPRGWPIHRVSDFVARFEGGKNLQAGSEAGTKYRILKVSAVTSGIYRESESKPAPDRYIAPSNHFVLKGDLLFSRANTEELVGATALVEDTNGTTLLPDKLWRFVWLLPVEPLYIFALFQSAYVRREMGKLSSGTSSSMRNISQAKLFSLALPVAPIDTQKAFSERLEQIRSIQSQQSLALEKAEATFQSLLHRAFAGEL